MESTPIKAILFTKTAAYRHASIPALASSLSNLPNLSLTHTEDPSVFQSQLPSQDILILGHNTRDFLDDETLEALKRFVETQEKGVVGVHACTCGMLKCDWYAEMLGARFDGHPEPQWGRVKVHHREDGDKDAEHEILRNLPHPSLSSVPALARPPHHEYLQHTLPTEFPWFDEWYNWSSSPNPPPPKGSIVLVSVDPTTYEGGPASGTLEETSGLHPLAWCHETRGSGTRVFYTALGHFDEAYSDPWFMKMLENGIRWTARRNIVPGDM